MAEEETKEMGKQPRQGGRAVNNNPYKERRRLIK